MKVQQFILISAHSPAVLLTMAFCFLFLGGLLNQPRFRRAVYYNMFAGMLLLWVHVAVVWLVRHRIPPVSTFLESFQLYLCLAIAAAFIFSILSLWSYQRREVFTKVPPSLVFVLLMTLGLSLLLASEYLLISSI